MGKGGSAKVEVTYYYLSVHYGICVAVDKLLGLIIKEKPAWSGDVSTLTQFAINNREAFGGDTKEGGLIGNVTFLPGAPDQVLPDVLAVRQGRANGADCVGYRGLASIYFHRESGETQGFYWGANNPFVPGVWAKVQRIFTSTNGDMQWYPEKAAALSTVGSVVRLETMDDLAGFEPGYSGTCYSSVGGWLRISDVLAGAPLVLADSSGEDYSYMSVDFRCLTDGIGDAGTLFIPGLVTIQPISEELLDPDKRLAVNDVPVTAGRIDLDTIYSVTAQLISPTVVAVKVYREGVLIADFESAPPSITSSVQFDTRDGAGYSGGMVTEYDNLYLTTGTVSQDMNPAHIIREALTDTTWGMGTPASALNGDSFTEAADTLFGEGFGLSMLWTRQTTIEAFIQEVLDHIKGVLFVQPSTGLLTLRLVRGDYDAGTLPELTPDNADLTDFSRKLWGEIVNEITVTWTNPDNEQEETVTAHDLASIAMQGGVVADSRNYYGVRNADLAQELAWRDLRSDGQPLASCEAEVDRTQWQIEPADVVKLTWPEYGLSEIVMRVVSVDYGKPGDPTLKLSLIEDVFGLDIGTYESPPSTEWTDPSAPPAPMEFVEILTLPLFLARDTTVAAFVDSPEYPEVVAGVLASTSSADTYEYQLWDEVNLTTGDPEWQNTGTNTIIGRAELNDALAAEATSTAVEFTGRIGNTSPVVGGFAIIGDEGEEGNEIALVTAIGATYELKRGTLDTIPRAWPAGSPVWFVDGSTLFEDRIVRSAAEMVDYKLLTRTSLGVLDFADAPLEAGTLTERPWLPNRPANIIAAGEAFTDSLAPLDVRSRPDPWVTVTWAIRNRLDEDAVVLGWTDASGTAETGQTTTIEVRDFDGTLLASHDGLAGTSFDVPDASFGTALFVELRVYSERSDGDGEFVSLQHFSHWLQVASLTADSDTVTVDSDIWTADEG